MDDSIRQRMQRALAMRNLDHYKVSISAGLNKNYLWESFNEGRRKGSLNGYKKIADKIGLSYYWLLEGLGEPFTDKIIVADEEKIAQQVDILLELFSEFQSCGKDQRILRLKLEIAILELLRKENQEK